MLSNDLGTNPDLEEIIADPIDDTIFYILTEDGTSAPEMSDECSKYFAHLGATAFPRLLVRLKLHNSNTAVMTNVRLTRVDPKMEIGNFPNNGIEGLAFGTNQILYLGLEKDKNN